MRFIYTKHANFRISQRELSKGKINATVAHPNKEVPGFKGRLIAQKNFGNKTLEVVYKKLNGEVVIITAYWLKEV